MRFIDLPVGAKKALVHYSILEAGNDALGDDVLEVENLDDDAWNAILARADKVWRKKHFSLSLLTSEQAAYFVERFHLKLWMNTGDSRSSGKLTKILTFLFIRTIAGQCWLCHPAAKRFSMGGTGSIAI